mmetsp:Transcript_4685/g.9413  ORF Transcript_4685/g.9413 Transcript_4685/m.9413 type:complete len:159 (+) Transcript_4685:32-508(+)
MPDSLSSNLVGNMSFGLIYGLAFGAVSAAWSSPPISDPRGFSALQTSSSEITNTFRTVGRTAVVFTAATGFFTVVSGVTKEIRQVNDPLNAAVGSAATGFMLGLSKRRLDLACAGGLGFGVVTFAGGILGSKWAFDENWTKKKRQTIAVAGPGLMKEE